MDTLRKPVSTSLIVACLLGRSAPLASGACRTSNSASMRRNSNIAKGRSGYLRVLLRYLDSGFVLGVVHDALHIHRG